MYFHHTNLQKLVTYEHETYYLKQPYCGINVLQRIYKLNFILNVTFPMCISIKKIIKLINIYHCSFFIILKYLATVILYWYSI